MMASMSISLSKMRSEIDRALFLTDWAFREQMMSEFGWRGDRGLCREVVSEQTAVKLFKLQPVCFDFKFTNPVLKIAGKNAHILV